MKKKYSIKENEAVQNVLANGRFYKCANCVVYVMKNGTNKNNVAFLAGKKLGHAPVRNKAKRKLRLAMHMCWPHLCKGYDIVLIARPFLLQTRQHILLKDLETLLKKHRILNEDIINISHASLTKKVGDAQNEDAV